MKYIISFVVILLSYVSSFAQDPELLDNKWYLQGVTIDNIEYETPNNFEVAFVTLDFIGTIILSSICSNGFVEGVTYISNNAFELDEFIPTTGLCDDNDNDEFKNIYFSFFESGVLDLFTYSIITEADESKTLLITNSLGDEVVYTNSYFDLAPQEVLENTWYLYNLTIDGDIFIPPVNGELPYVPLNFSEAWLQTDVCNYLDSNALFNVENSSFISTEFTFSLIDCSFQANATFEGIYFNFYFENNPLAYPFTYLITTEGTSKTLTITNYFGDEAIYGNEMLSTLNFSISLFTIYPNPVRNSFKIVYKNNLKVKTVNIYDVLGKLVLEEKEDVNQIDVSNLSNGLFFIKIETDKGNSTKKIIKQ